MRVRGGGRNPNATIVAVTKETAVVHQGAATRLPSRRFGFLT